MDREFEQCDGRQQDADIGEQCENWDDSMRMLFEVHKTPVAMSRAAMLYVNKEDIGWSGIIEGWVARREELKRYFSQFREYLPPPRGRRVGCGERSATSQHCSHVRRECGAHSHALARELTRHSGCEGCLP